MKTKIIFILIILFGLFVRLYKLDANSLYGDELTIGLDAFTLLHTGRDQLGNWFPVTFKMRGVSPPVYVYGTIPFIALLGNNEYGVRVLSVLSGLGVMVLIYLITNLFFSKKVAFYALLLSALSPWEISLSRGGFESHFALFLSLLGIWSGIKSLQKPVFLILSVLSFCLAMFTYPTYKMLMPLFGIDFILFLGVKEFISKKHIKLTIVSVIVALFFFALFLIEIFRGSESRFLGNNIFFQETIKQNVTQTVNNEREIVGNNLFNMVFHNKYLTYSNIYVSNYFNNFSIDFLLLSGDGNPRHNPAETGQFFIIEIVSMLLGIFILLKQEKKIRYLFLFWIIISPLAGSLMGGPHALRNSFLLPPLIILSALGITSLPHKFKIIFFILLLFQFIVLFERLILLSPVKHADFWSQRAKKISQEVAMNSQKYDFVFLEDSIDNIEYAYPFYTNTTPVIIINNNNEKIYKFEYPFKKYDNIYIGNIPNQLKLYLTPLINTRRVLVLDK